jgi:restriction endonuclease Mrr
MQQATIQTELFVTLAQHYEHDPAEFVTLPRQTVDSSFVRVAVAELRNEGYVEEQVRGVVRLTARGYQVFRSHPVPAA